MRKNMNLLSYKLKIDKQIMENLKFKQCEGLFNWYFIHTEKSFVYKMKNGNIYACCKNIFANFFNPLIIIDSEKIIVRYAWQQSFVILTLLLTFFIIMSVLFGFIIAIIFCSFIACLFYLFLKLNLYFCYRIINKTISESCRSFK